jgi:TetR/AcrR family transcriptional regulator
LKQDQPNKHQTILDIACGIFAKFGFAKTTLDDIAEAVGMKTGSLYYYFDSKEAIFSEVIGQIAAQIKEKMLRDVEKERTARAKILKFGECGLRYSDEAANVLGVTAQTKLELLPLAEHILKNFHVELLGYLASLIDQGIESGEFKPCDSSRIAWALHAVVQGMEWAALHETSTKMQKEINIDSIVGEVNFLSSLILDGLQTSAPAAKTT